VKVSQSRRPPTRKPLVPKHEEIEDAIGSISGIPPPISSDDDEQVELRASRDPSMVEDILNNSSDES